MASFKPFNYGQAITDGQAIAGNALKLRNGVRQEQGNNMLREVAARGVTGRDKYNMLAKSGRGDLARTEQAKDMQMANAKTEWLKSQVSMVSDEPSFQAMVQRVEGSGLAPPGSTHGKFGATWMEAKDNLALFSGREASAQLYGNNRPTERDPNRYGQPPVDASGNVQQGQWKNTYNQKQNVVTDDNEGWRRYQGKGAKDKARGEAVLAIENATVLHGQIGDLVKKIKDSPSAVGGVGGTIVNQVNSFRQQYRQITGKVDLVVNGKINDEVVGELSNENADWLRKTAMQSETKDSATRELAFVVAKSYDPSGKLSDRDIIEAKAIIDNPDRAIATKKLLEIDNRFINRYNRRRESKKGYPDLYKHWQELPFDSYMSKTKGEDKPKTKEVIEQEFDPDAWVNEAVGQ